MPAARIHPALVLAFRLLAIASVASTVYFVLIAHWSGTFKDMWWMMPFLQAMDQGTANLADFWALHGGAHRIALPRLLYWIEYRHFGGTNAFLTTLAVLLQGAAAALLLNSIRREAMERSLQQVLGAIVLLFVFSATQLENYLYTFDIQWILAALFTIFALRAIAGMDPQQPARALLVAGSSGFLASLCSMVGVCTLITTVAMAALLRLPRKAWLAYAAVVAAYLAAYFQAVPVEAPVNQSGNTIERLLGEVWLTWLRLRFTGGYLGAPLSGLWVWPGVLLGWASIAFLLRTLWQAIGQPPASALQRLALALALWGFIVAASTAAGRIIFPQTFASDRFQTVVMLYWAGLCLWLLLEAVQRQRTHRTALLVLVMAVPLLASGDCAIIQRMLDWSARVQQSKAALITGVTDMDAVKDTLILGDMWSGRNRAQWNRDFLLAKHWGVFAEPEAAWLQNGIASQPLSVATCSGSFGLVPRPATTGSWFASGEAHWGNGTPVRVVVVTSPGGQQGKGVGYWQRPTDYVGPANWAGADRSHWSGYAMTTETDTELEAWAMDGKGHRCLLDRTSLPARQ